MNEPAVTLRPCVDADRGFLYRVYASTRAEELAPVPWSDAEKTTFLRQQFRAQDIHYKKFFPEADYRVVQIDGEPAGRLYIRRQKDEIGVMDIALLPEHRGKGIGGALLKKILEEGDRAGLPVIAHVEHNNPARRLYSRLGFEDVDEMGVYIRIRREPS